MLQLQRGPKNASAGLSNSGTDQLKPMTFKVCNQTVRTGLKNLPPPGVMEFRFLVMLA